MKYIKLILFLILCVFAIDSYSQTLIHPEIGLGYSYAITNGDGTWYQKKFPHSMKRSRPVMLVGAYSEITPYINIHMDFVDLGNYSVDSQDTPSDANYNPKSPTGCNGACLPMAHYMGSGNIYGFQFPLEIHTNGNWKFGLEAGPFVYHSSWTVSVPNWYPSVQTSPTTWTTGPITPVYRSNSNWFVGDMFGVSVEHDTYKVSLNYYYDGHGWPINGDPWEPLWSRHIVLFISKEF